MKKLDNLMHDVDESFDKKFGPILTSIKKYFPAISTITLATLMLIFFVKTVMDKPYHLAAIITNDLNEIEKILSEIDKNCNILSINNSVVPVDFLNIQKFAGSTVGCLNLAYPSQWTGPYLRRNPTLQGKFYEILKAKDGIYVIPGQGTKLPNGFVRGKDIIVNPDVSMSELIREGGLLNYKGLALAVKLTFKVGDWDSPIKKAGKDESKLEKINTALKEFNQAFSFTSNPIQEIKA